MGALTNRVTIAAARVLERLAYRNATQVIALSPDIKAGVIASGYPEERVTVIPNACDLELFDVGPAPGLALRRQHQWLQHRPLVVYTGTLGRVNGVAYLAHLAAEVGRLDPEVCFVVVGDGREEDHVRCTAERLGVLGRNFFMLREMPKTEIARWLSAADIATSLVIDLRVLWANSANKVFDALAAGKPVAINHRGWQAELLEHTGAGLVLDPRDFTLAASSLVSALRDGQWLTRARGAARTLATERFNRDRLASQLDQVLSQAAVGANQLPPTLSGFRAAGTHGDSRLRGEAL
jgi:glycosyltransferase involved in cell wall biosynthesis